MNIICWGTVCYCLWLGISISLLIVLFLFEPHISIFYFVQIGAIFVWCYVYNIVPAYRDENDTIIQINSTLVQKLYGGASTESLREELLSKDFPNSQDCEAPSNMLLKRPEERIEVVPLFFFCWETLTYSIPYSGSFCFGTTLFMYHHKYGTFDERKW